MTRQLNAEFVARLLAETAASRRELWDTPAPGLKCTDSHMPVLTALLADRNPRPAKRAAAGRLPCAHPCR